MADVAEDARARGSRPSSTSSTTRMSPAGSSTRAVGRTSWRRKSPRAGSSAKRLRRRIEIILAHGGVATIGVSHIVRLIGGLQFDTIHHEHCSHFSLTTLIRLFGSHGLEVFDVEELPSHGGSLRVYVKRRGDSAHEVGQRVGEILQLERSGGFDRLEGYEGFSERVAETRWALLGTPHLARA